MASTSATPEAATRDEEPEATGLTPSARRPFPTLQAVAYIGTSIASSSVINAAATVQQVSQFLGFGNKDRVSRQTLHLVHGMCMWPNDNPQTTTG